MIDNAKSYYDKRHETYKAATKLEKYMREVKNPEGKPKKGKRKT